MRRAVTTTPSLARIVAPFYRWGHLPLLIDCLHNAAHDLDHFVYLSPCLTPFTMHSMRKRLLSAVFPAVSVRGLKLFTDHDRG